MKKLILFLLELVMASSAFAQSEYNWRYSGQVGIGLNYVKFSDSKNGISLYSAINMRDNQNVFSVSYLNCSDLSIFSTPNEYISTLDLKYGRVFDFKMRGLIYPLPFLLMINNEFNYSIVVKSGLSYIRSQERKSLVSTELFNSTYTKEIKNGFGVPIEVELKEEIFKYFGFTLGINGNLNTIKSFYGFYSGIYIGEM